VKFALPIAIEERYKTKEATRENIRSCLNDAFVTVHDTFKTNVPSPEFSGTTCCTLLLKGRTIYSANAGDSRAIIITDKRKVTELTLDHKPENPEEKKRILEAGGRVHALTNH